MPSLNYREFRLTRESNHTSWDKNIMKCSQLANEHMELRIRGCFYTQMCLSKVPMPVPFRKSQRKTILAAIEGHLGMVGTQPDKSC